MITTDEIDKIVDDQKIRETLATKVMGWRLVQDDEFEHAWIKNNNDWVMSYIDWNPLENIAQAFQCLEALCSTGT